jgi:hypothetical protein
MRLRSTRQRAGLAAGDLVRSLLDRHGIARELREHRILARWREIVGPSLGERTWPDGLERGLLWVRVKNSSWLHQLSFLRDDLVARLNRELGDPPLIKDIRFHVGARGKVADDDALAPTLKIRRALPRERQPPAPPSAARAAEIRGESEAIEDETLRRIILDLRMRWNL